MCERIALVEHISMIKAWIGGSNPLRVKTIIGRVGGLGWGHRTVLGGTGDQGIDTSVSVHVPPGIL